MARVNQQFVPPEWITYARKILDPSYEPPKLGNLGPYWRPATTYQLGATIIEPCLTNTPPTLRYNYIATQPGLSHPWEEPLWPPAGSIQDNEVTWQRGTVFPTINEISRKKGPSHLEPPHIPTARQLAVRTAMTRITHTIEKMTTTEKHRWWIHAQERPDMEYWNWVFRDFWLDVWKYGDDPDTYLWPRTSVADPERAADFPMITINYPDRFAFLFHYWFFLDGGTNRYHDDSRYPTALYYIWDRCYFESGYGEWAMVFNPAWPMMEYYGAITLPEHSDASPFLYRKIRFTMQLEELDRRCIAIEFNPYPDPTVATYELDNFWGPENPYPL